jgi:thymidine kinase
MTHSGKVHLIIGPMFAGKTSFMLAHIETYCRSHKKCAIIKHARDTRYTEEANCICTHNGCANLLREIVCTSANVLSRDLIAHDIEVVGIDEAQFFATDAESAREMANVIDEWCLSGRIVICAGLDTDWMREPFPYLAPVMSRADRITKLRARCECGAAASFSARRNIRVADFANPVGGSEKYVACCRACYCDAKNMHS